MLPTPLRSVCDTVNEGCVALVRRAAANRTECVKRTHGDQELSSISAGQRQIRWILRADYGDPCFGGGDAFGGEFVLQVALELADGGDDVDDQGGGGVVGGQVGEVGQWAGQDAQLHAAVLAPVADGVDVDEVAAEPEEF